MKKKKKRKKKKKKKLKERSPFVLSARMRHAGPMKDKREERGGVKNTQFDFLKEDED